MTVLRLLFLVGLTLISMFLLAVGWEFVVEELIDQILFGRFASEPPSERWEYIFTATSFVGIALIIPTILSLRLIHSQKHGRQALYVQ